MLNKEFIIIFSGKVFLTMISILSIKILTTLLTPYEMGKIYIFLVVASFFLLFFINPLTQYFFRFMNHWKSQKNLFNMILFMSLYFLIIAAIALVYLLITIKFDIFNKFNTESIALILFGFIFFQSLNQFIIPLLNMLHYRFCFTILTVLTAFGIIVFGYLFVKLFGNNAENWLLGTVVSNMLFMIVGFFLLRNRLNEKFHGFFYNLRKITKEKIKSILIFVLPLSVATLFMWLQNSGYRILIEQNISLEFLGFLGVGLAISGQIASTVESIIMQYFHPIYYQQITNANIEERKKAIETFINKALPIYLMLAIFLTFLAKYVVEILVDEKYYGVYVFTAFGIWIEFFRMSSNLFGNISQSEMNTKKFMMPYIVGSLLTVFLVYFSSVNIEYKFYLPFSLLVGGFFTMLLMYISMKKLINFTIDFRLIILSFIISSPYISICFFNFQTSLVLNLLLVGSFGLYFLGTIYFIYKKGLSFGNS